MLQKSFLEKPLKFVSALIICAVLGGLSSAPPTWAMENDNIDKKASTHISRLLKAELEKRKRNIFIHTTYVASDPEKDSEKKVTQYSLAEGQQEFLYPLVKVIISKAYEDPLKITSVSGDISTILDSIALRALKRNESNGYLVKNTLTLIKSPQTLDAETNELAAEVIKDLTIIKDNYGLFIKAGKDKIDISNMKPLSTAGKRGNG